MRYAALGAALLIGCAAAPGVGGSAQVASSYVPTGARVGPQGYATVLRAPSPDYRKIVERQPKGPASEAGWYARSNNISVAEATKRLAEQQALVNELNRLGELLPKLEAGNYSGSRMVHQPDWGYVYYFKRDPAATLAKYTRHPSFKAAQARYIEKELGALIEPWAVRFTQAGVIGGYGSDPTLGTAEFMMTVTEAEYRSIAGREGWGAVPDAFKLEFPKELAVPPVSRGAAPFVRTFAQNDKATGIQLTAAGMGRIILRDGCLMVEMRGLQTPHLAYFHKETGIGTDGQGYLALIDRMTGKPNGRIGEMFTWGAPNAFAETMPGVAELRARCGNAAVAHIGNPHSSAMMDAIFR